MTTIPQKELRNDVAGVLRRAQDGEQFTVTVAGRPVAELGPVRDRAWVPARTLVDLWSLPVDPSLGDDLGGFAATLEDPWERT